MLAIIQSLMLFMSIFAVMGSNVSILRLVPEYIVKFSVLSAFSVYKKIRLLVFLASLTIGIIFYLSRNFIANYIFYKPQLSFYIGLVSLFVLFKALSDLNTGVVRAMRANGAFSLMQVLPNLSMLAALFVFMATSHDIDDPVFAQFVGWIISSFIGVFIVLRLFKGHSGKNELIADVRYIELVKISFPMLMTSSINFFIGQIGILILGMYRPPADVGLYSVAVRLATLTVFLLQAINSMAAPKFSELYHKNKIEELFRVGKKSTKLIFIVTSPILLILVFFGSQILNLFGDDFSRAYIPMVILIFGQFFNSISGSTGYVMTMTGNHCQFNNIMLFSSVFNVVLSLFLCPTFGIIGISISTSFSVVLWNILVTIYIRRKFSNTVGLVY